DVCSSDLTDRGRRGAARIGRALETLGWRPRQIFHSTAVRARDTATILAATAGWENLPREAVDGLYGADSATAMELIGTRAGGGQALFIGHQPVLSALVEDWTGMRHGSVPRPTSAVALLVRSGDPSPAAPYRLERLRTPRDLDPG